MPISSDYTYIHENILEIFGDNNFLKFNIDLRLSLYNVFSFLNHYKKNILHSYILIYTNYGFTRD